MLIKSKRIIKRIFATFLILSLTLCYFTISVSASQRYVHVNDTVYESAKAYGLEELPYGTDTGVVQFQYGDKFLTLYFDKLTIYQGTNGQFDNEGRYLNDWYWNAIYDDSSGELDYLFNCVSDSPIYYKIAYDSGGIFSSSIGTLTEYEVHYPVVVDGNTDSLSTIYDVYVLDNFRLSSLVPSSWSLTGERRVYSNCYQLHADVVYTYYPYRASGPTSWVNGKNVGYNVEYYPTVEYLQNYDIRAQIVTAWKEVVELQDITTDILNELYTVNVYLQDIRTYLYQANAKLLNIYNLQNVQLPLINKNLTEVISILEEILSGPEYDSSQGIGSNTEFGDAAGGLMQDTNVPDMDVGGIQSNLGNSFMFIRNMFDWVTGKFNLGYIISFLLGLSFIAYVLGRVIKNKMNNS